ncbi:hypothetical protein BOTBODRAFT_535973 [Botryobasidium botryosum FD-172 SS1]|uniref:Malate dehydrogenase n=1 Tax=Botryobasidium botryosum (strain FD-172 SS1) TaxID=930990 RepID=A0A067MB58_BOTB1|nr:hypothetical protein BOTBODRAFT_535973 [Botryobasidium botryosum FD-172 SS1]
MISVMNMLSALFSVATLSQLVAASPVQYGCPTQNDVLQLPPSQSQLYVPPGEKPSHIVLGLGVQNYTCSPTTGLYVSAGARAALYDISCQYGTPAFATITQDAFVQFNDEDFNLDSPPTAGLVGSYYFTTTESGISPEWDFFSYSSGSSGFPSFVIGSEVGRIPAPTGFPQDIDWVQWTNIDGGLARTMFQVQTKSGQPPAYCPAGSPDISVKYAAQYWLF